MLQSSGAFLYAQKALAKYNNDPDLLARAVADANMTYKAEMKGTNARWGVEPILRDQRPADNVHDDSSYANTMYPSCLVQKTVFVVVDLADEFRPDRVRGLREARQIIEEWRIDYNTNRPHTSLAGLTPNEFAARPFEGHNRNRLSL